jgi:hypothetical protein
MEETGFWQFDKFGRVASDYMTSSLLLRLLRESPPPEHLKTLLACNGNHVALLVREIVEARDADGILTLLNRADLFP